MERSSSVPISVATALTAPSLLDYWGPNGYFLVLESVACIQKCGGDIPTVSG